MGEKVGKLGNVREWGKGWKVRECQGMGEKVGKLGNGGKGWKVRECQGMGEKVGKLGNVREWGKRS